MITALAVLSSFTRTFVSQAFSMILSGDAQQYNLDVEA
jgi:hypothetical protein